MRSPPPNHGRFSSEKEALQAVVQRLVDALHPASIYLFGSRAEGRARPDSDFDLLDVMEDSTNPWQDSLAAARRVYGAA